ncbi:MAG: hypothetical protein HOV80_00945 [Polyangiaceae bacterium]|nr:hypothetical protein [Polyangiaceae bacterium]
MRKLGLIGCALGLFWIGCNEVRVGDDGEDGEPSGPPDPPPQQLDPVPQMTTTDKVDLLFVVDNSISMADKQGVLAPSAVRLVRDLTNPPCIDASGSRLPDNQQPASPADACPTGSTRSGTPVTDLRVGFISSSLGALTAANCNINPSGDDGAHLLTRGPGGNPVATYQNLGFLAFDPAQMMNPPGEATIDGLEQSITDLVIGVDEDGCGYEMPLEAMARFLVDPAPYDSLSPGADGVLMRNGIDTVLLQQRADFIRPDSLVSIVMLSDENDCSIDVSKQGYLTLGATPFYKSTSACQVDPNDACCTSCALEVPAGCAPDPACGAQGTASAAKYLATEDHGNLRCWDQKRRYGVDFQYPLERYTNALSLSTIDPAVSSLAPSGGGVPNPLFAGGRPSAFVSLTAIVGVPWQDLATNPNDPQSPNKTTSEMEADGSWGWLVEGGDPFMIESVAARSGSNPATGASVSTDNAINGGDRTAIQGDELQYTCIFGLEEAEEFGGPCGECIDASCDDPLCNLTTQVAAKANPGVRQLKVVRSLGDRGIAGSICPSDLPAGAPPVQTMSVRGYDRPILDLETRVWQHIAP